jgi:predicted dinucleotide-binding enzyme
MDIGIIGTGNMGRVVGLALAERGHRVFFGARDGGDGARAAAMSAGTAAHGSNDEAAAFGEVLLWTIRGVAPAEVIADLSRVRGKVVVDVNNTAVPPDGAMGPPRGERSQAERLAAALPGARVVKAFNTMAQEVFALEPEVLAAQRVSGFIAGDDAAAKEVVGRLVADLGFEVRDAGALLEARRLEGLADFVRHMMGRGLGVYATLSVHVVPEATSARFGGRQPTRLP